ncbi:MAG: hypothetical protein MJ126_10280 [Lachnospiraceae bacterium]|nr:hypothetical protein [Lachnospiraceae bacterium]
MKVVAIIRKVYAALYILNTLLGIIGMLAISMFDNHRFGRFTIVGPLVTLVICAIPMLILLIFIGSGAFAGKAYGASAGILGTIFFLILAVIEQFLSTAMAAINDSGRLSYYLPMGSLRLSAIICTFCFVTGWVIMVLSIVDFVGLLIQNEKENEL